MPTNTPSRYPSYVGNQILEHSVTLVAATVTTGGAVVSVSNPLGADVIIIEACLNVTTAATTSTNTIDLGVAATAATTSDTLIDGTTTTTGIKPVGGTNGLKPRLWPAAQFVTGTASATLVGMVGTLHLVYIRA